MGSGEIVARLGRGRRSARTAVVLLATALLAGCGYNTIQRYDEQAAQAQHDIEVQLQRRGDLIGNLVNTVRGQANQELAVFTNVSRARAGLDSAVQSHDPEKMANANANLSAQVAILNRSVVEAYPQLKSDQAFMRLQDELSGTENRIAVARGDYNQAVESYNAYIRQFPQALTARVIGSKPRTYYTATGEAQTAPKVDFGKPGT
jgi:LemA protein